MACAGELQQLIASVELGRGACLVVEGRSLPAIEVPATTVRVVHHRASAEEQLLTHGTLVDLCAPLRGWVDRLGPRQTAVLSELFGGRAASAGLAVATAFRDLLQAAAADDPLVVIVEGAHLLDRGSAAAVGFAARATSSVPLGLVVTQEAGALGRLDLPFATRCHHQAPSDSGRPGPSIPSRSPDDLAAAAWLGDASELLRSGSALLHSGQLDQALEVAQEARCAAQEPGAVAASELLLGRVRLLEGSGAAAAAHLRSAIEVASPEDPDLAAEAALLLSLPAIIRGRADRVEAALAEVAAQLDQAGLGPTHHLRALHAAAGAALDIVVGRPVDEAALSGLAERLAASGEPADVSLVVNAVALPLVWLEHHGSASALLRALVRALRASDAASDLALVLCALSVTERRAGRPSRALVLASEARELAEDRGLEVPRRFALSELANVHGIMGDLERCRVVASALFDVEPAGRSLHRISTLSGLATGELWAGDPNVAVDLLEPLTESSAGVPAVVTLYHPTLITAYAAVGRYEDARRLLDQVEGAVHRPGRTAAAVARCRALLAPPAERDAAFAAAEASAAANPMSRGFTRLLHARRLLGDGEAVRGADLLRELAALSEEDLLGVARGARLTLARLGMALASGRPAWATVERGQLDVALDAAQGPPRLAMAWSRGVSDDELERLRSDVAAAVGFPTPGTTAEGPGRAHPERQIQVLGGLVVTVDGQRLELPVGAASTTVALLALRRGVHVEELTEVLWPGAPGPVARRRLRNVLARIRQAVGPILVRRGERIVLADDVRVDHHELEVRARRALAEPPGPARAQHLAEVLCAHQGVLLPEAAYEEWAQAARRRSEVRHEELVQALAAERDRG